MADSGKGGPSGGHEIDPSIRWDALGVLTEMLVWQLPPDRWAAIGHIIDDIEPALRTGDGSVIKAAVAELDLMSPVRITEIGTEPTVPPPPRIRERTNQLVHALGTTADRKEHGRGEEKTNRAER
jgi:hypothetical protein